MTLILVNLNFPKPFYMETNASNFTLETVLSQMTEEERLHVVVF